MQCSLPDKELCEFIHFKEQKAGNVQKKYAVTRIGLQADGTWVMGSNIYLSSKGETLSMDQSQYIWISDLLTGPAVATMC